MKNLKVEQTAFDYKDKKPASWFLKELSKQCTPKIKKLIVSDNLRNVLTDFVCLTFDPGSYMSLPCRKNVMTMCLSSRSAAFNVCDIVVSWSSETGFCPYPWEADGGNAIHFDVLVEDSEKRKLNTVLPMLYHPIVRSSQSGLSFDYQIFYGGETLRIFFNQPILEEVQDKLTESILLFIDQWNKAEQESICLIDIRKTGTKVVQVHVDFGSNGESVARRMIHSLECIYDIKKVICR